MSDETITLEIEPAKAAKPISPFPGNWVGEKPPIACNKATSLCGYLRCQEEGRCLQEPVAKRTK